MGKGGMFVEADCNIASGEALVRQFVHGQRFSRKEFSVVNSILWLPDVFGYYSAAAIMQKCGLPYFMTTNQLESLINCLVILLNREY